MRWLIVALGLAGATPAAADATVSVTLNELGRDLAADLGLSVPELIAHAESRIDELYRVSRIDPLLRSFADTAAFVQRGLGADYDVDAGDVMLGLAVAGVHGDVAIGTNNKLLGGSVINFSGLAGVNLSRWRHPRWTVFANGFYTTTTLYGLEGRLLTLGSHVQYQVIPISAPARARWTGVAVTSGLEYARWSIGIASSLESHFTAQGPAERATVHMSSTGALDVLTSTLSVPLEVTTGARLGPLSFYAGAGARLTTGDSTITARLDSVLSINADRLPIGDAIITGTGENTPSPAAVHALVGTAVHTRHARVVVQAALATGELSLCVGLRMVP